MLRFRLNVLCFVTIIGIPFWFSIAPATDGRSKPPGAAARWYETRQPGLGRQFLTEMRSAFERIRSNPVARQVAQRALRARSTAASIKPRRLAKVADQAAAAR